MKKWKNEFQEKLTLIAQNVCQHIYVDCTINNPGFEGDLEED